MGNDQHNLSRRNFLTRLAAHGASFLGFASSVSADSAALKPALVGEPIRLNGSDIHVSPIGMGTGVNGGQIFKKMASHQFNGLVHHAIHRGITFFDTADSYDGMHEKLGRALKGIDRTHIQIMTKIDPYRSASVGEVLNRLRSEMGTDYFDICLIHCVQSPDWPTLQRRMMDALAMAKKKGIIRAHGISIHGLDALKTAATEPWGDVRFVRVNHKGTYMDGLTGKWDETAPVPPVMKCLEQMHSMGKAVIGMKIFGHGTMGLKSERETSLRFVSGLSFVDAAVIGFTSPSQIDETLLLCKKVSQHTY